VCGVKSFSVLILRPATVPPDSIDRTVVMPLGVDSPLYTRDLRTGHTYTWVLGMPSVYVQCTRVVHIAVTATDRGGGHGHRAQNMRRGHEAVRGRLESLIKPRNMFCPHQGYTIKHLLICFQYFQVMLFLYLIN
jgi:hypothetical protein